MKCRECGSTNLTPALTNKNWLDCENGHRTNICPTCGETVTNVRANGRPYIYCCIGCSKEGTRDKLSKQTQPFAHSKVVYER